MRPHTSGIIAQGEPPAHAYSNHFHPEEDIEHHDGQTDFSTTEDEEWIDEGEISGSDSFINEEQPPPPRGRRQEYQSRHLRQAPQYYPVRHASSSTPSLDPAEEFGPYGRPYHPQQGGRGGMYPRGPMPPYPQNQGGNYGGYRPNQIIPQNNNYGQNPFSPMNTSNNPGYFGHDHMPMYGNDVMQYPPYYRGPPHAGALPAYMQQFHVSQPNGHPVDQHGALVQQAPTPAESPAPDPERLRLEAELAAFKMQQEKIKQVERHREMEAQIRKDTEEALNRRMDQLRLEQEEHRKELEKARAEAERAARERIEAERKADEERARQHAEAMRQAEEKARMKFEAEMKAAEAKRKREEEDRKRAEEAAKIRLEAAIRAEADARAAAEKKAKEEMDRLKAIQEEAKRKAEADALAKVEAEKEAERKRKEAEEVAKKEHEALKKKIQEETKAKLEEAAKNTADKAPIKFKDALGRKFSFPYHLCSRWQGMEELIKQAFQQVDVLGPQVQEGWYDLIGPNGEIILPAVWERTIQPDWSITMTMWPMDRFPPGHPRFPGLGRGRGIPIPPMAGRPGMPGVGGARAIPFPPGMPLPPNWPQQGHGKRGSGIPVGVEVVDAAPQKSSSKSKRNSAVLTFFSGKQPSKKKSSKK